MLVATLLTLAISLLEPMNVGSFLHLRDASELSASEFAIQHNLWLLTRQNNHLASQNDVIIKLLLGNCDDDEEKEERVDSSATENTGHDSSQSLNDPSDSRNDVGALSGQPFGYSDEVSLPVAVPHPQRALLMAGGPNTFGNVPNASLDVTLDGLLVEGIPDHAVPIPDRYRGLLTPGGVFMPWLPVPPHLKDDVFVNSETLHVGIPKKMKLAQRDVSRHDESGEAAEEDTLERGR